MSDKLRDQPRWRYYLNKLCLGKRFFLGFVFLLCLVGFIHFREIRVGTFFLDNHAKNYIVAQVDFEFPDEDGTVILRQEAARDIGAIYQISSASISSSMYDFETFLFKNQNWRQVLPHTTFENLYETAEKVKDILEELRFADNRTLHRLKGLELLPKNYHNLPQFSHRNRIVLPESLWIEIETLLTKKSNRSEIPSELMYVVNTFQHVEWGIEQNTSDQKAMRKLVEETVPMRMRKLRAGSQIINQGDQITQKQLAMLQAMKQALTDKQRVWEPLSLLGSFIFGSLILYIGVCYLKLQHSDVFKSFNKLFLYVIIIVITFLISKVFNYFIINDNAGIIEYIRYPLLIPFASILICVLINTELAVFSTCFLSIVLGLVLPVDHGFFIFTNLIAGLIAVIASVNMRKRKEVFSVCGKVFLFSIPIFIAYSFSKDVFFNLFILYDVLTTFVFLCLTSIVVVGLLPVFESVFDIMTDITLMEYMDPNNDLLRRLSLEAPGTYQHSLVVGSISESAAHSIEANGLFCRVSTLYHDIGKLFNPHYFTENQMGGFDIHQLLTPKESAQVIIAHVHEGELLAKKHGLPHSFIDIIREHHGNTLVQYFYCKNLELASGDVNLLDEKSFRYPGPKPKTKEAAIIMMADAVEAASRSLNEVNEETITALVNRLVGEKLEDGQFDECLLTFDEFQKVKSSLIQTLVVARHLRIRYPEKKI